MAKTIGCIVMYSKPLEKHKTVPRGTIFYTDGTEKEVSLKEAAEKALSMAMEYGYSNAIDNERYFNITYEDFMKNKDRYRTIATESKSKEERPAKKTTVKKTEKPRKLPDGITEVEPPIKAKDGTKTKKEPELGIPEVTNNQQVLYGPAPQDIVEEVVQVEQDLYGPAPPEIIDEPDDIDFDRIEQKLKEVIDRTAVSDKPMDEPTQDDLQRMIDRQNKKVTEGDKKKR